MAVTHGAPCILVGVCRSCMGTFCNFSTPLHGDGCWIGRLIARMQYIGRAGKIWMGILGGLFVPYLSDKTIPPRCFPLAASMQSKHIRTYVRGLSLCLMLQKRRVRGTAAGKVSPAPPELLTHTHFAFAGRWILH